MLKLDGLLFYFNTFALMNKRNSITSLVLGVIVFFAILLQSFHSGSHLVSLISEKKCNHHYTPNKTELNHGHHTIDHCFVCEFTFSTSLKSDLFSFNFKKIEFPVSYSAYCSKEIINSFRGALFALRAPPSLIV